MHEFNSFQPEFCSSKSVRRLRYPVKPEQPFSERLESGIVFHAQILSLILENLFPIFDDRILGFVGHECVHASSLVSSMLLQFTRGGGTASLETLSPP